MAENDFDTRRSIFLWSDMQHSGIFTVTAGTSESACVAVQTRISVSSEDTILESMDRPTLQSSSPRPVVLVE